MNLKQKVLREVCKIPKGKTKTYKEIAKKLKTSPRFVAKILSQNLNPIKIPCHRVIRSNGKISGYTFKGKRRDKMKIKLLKKEGVKIKDNKMI
jgi:methylated-DNA-[protein]-cysteine S-methyltransferase